MNKTNHARQWDALQKIPDSKLFLLGGHEAMKIDGVIHYRCIYCTQWHLILDATDMCGRCAGAPPGTCPIHPVETQALHDTVERLKIIDTEAATLRAKVERFRKALKWIKGRFPFSRWSTADGTGHWHCRSCGTDMEIDDPKHEPDCPVGILIEAAQEKGKEAGG